MISDKVRDDVLKVYLPGPPEYDLEVLDVGQDTVTIRVPSEPDDDLFSDEILGLAWEGGYGQVAEVVSRSDDRVELRLTHVSGHEIKASDRAALDGFALPPDPRLAHGIEFTEVTYKAELGEFPAWFGITDEPSVGSAVDKSCGQPTESWRT